MVQCPELFRRRVRTVVPFAFMFRIGTATGKMKTLGGTGDEPDDLSGNGSRLLATSWSAACREKTPKDDPEKIKDRLATDAGMRRSKRPGKQPSQELEG
jgi:hypothetical protein